MCVSYASRKCFTVIGLWPVGWCDRSMSLTRTHHATVVGPIRFSNRSNNCRVCKINGRQLSLVRTHHATIVFSSYLRPTDDKNRMVCAGLKLGELHGCFHWWYYWRFTQLKVHPTEYVFSGIFDLFTVYEIWEVGWYKLLFPKKDDVWHFVTFAMCRYISLHMQ